MIQMNLHQLAAIVGGSMVGKEARIQGVTTDSRADCSGKLFVALQGEFFNGEDFCQAAVENGAVAVLVANAVEVEVPQLIVKDTLVALQAMATAWVKQTGVKVVGITGSNGKTTVKNMLFAVVSPKYQCFATQGNYNNEIGVPLSLLAVSKNDDVAVIEMGAAQIGDIAKLTSFIQPDIALITNIGDAHVGRFGGVDNIAIGKAEIYQALSHEGKGIVNIDSPYADDFRKKIAGDVVTFGQSEQADFRLIENGATYQIRTRRGEVIDLELPVLGLHNYMNATAVVAIALTLRLSIEEIQKGLLAFVPEHGRLELHHNDAGLTVIDDSYNANPTAVKAAIMVLNKQTKPTTLVVGDMAELGDDAAEMHQDVGAYAAAHDVDRLFVVGEYAKAVANGYQTGNNQAVVFETVADLLAHLKVEPLTSGTVLVKGSRSMRLERVVHELLGAGS